MALPLNPISGDHTLTNDGFDDRWTCPNCYADHNGLSDDAVVDCKCGARLQLTVEYQPVCRATCVDPDEVGLDEDV